MVLTTVEETKKTELVKKRVQVLHNLALAHPATNKGLCSRQRSKFR